MVTQAHNRLPTDLSPARFGQHEWGQWPSLWQSKGNCFHHADEIDFDEFACETSSALPELVELLQAKLAAHASESIRRHAEQAAFDAMTTVVEVTTELFGDNVTIRNSYDPEYPKEKLVVFAVEVRDIRDAIAKEREWAKRISIISRSWSAFRLSVTMAE